MGRSENDVSHASGNIKGAHPLLSPAASYTTHCLDECKSIQYGAQGEFALFFIALRRDIFPMNASS